MIFSKAGYLFVHLFSSLHVITGSIGPERVFATGGLRYWKDGRDVPDVTLGLYDYGAQATHPAFNVQMRVNFADGSGGGSRARLIGTEGVMTVGGRSIKIEKVGLNTQPNYRGYDWLFDTTTARVLRYLLGHTMTFDDVQESERPRTAVQKSYRIYFNNAFESTSKNACASIPSSAS